MGNQFFQYWAGRWVAEQLGAMLKIHLNEPLQLDPALFPNIVIEVEQAPGRFINNPANGQYNAYHLGQDNRFIQMVDLDAIVKAEMGLSRPVFLDFHFENYTQMRPREAFIRNLFQRSPNHPLKPSRSMVVHLRIGDLESNAHAFQADYIAFARGILARTSEVDEVVVLCEHQHPLLDEMSATLSSLHPKVVIESKDYQSDWDRIASASVIVMTNSTFSWWPAFLNPFEPKVHVFVSDKQGLSFRGETLFADSPDSWSLSTKLK